MGGQEKKNLEANSKRKFSLYSLLNKKVDSFDFRRHRPSAEPRKFPVFCSLYRPIYSIFLVNRNPASIILIHDFCQIEL